MVQRVELDGVEVYSNDISAAPGSGQANIPLGNIGIGTKKKVVIEVKAIRPDPGAGWGDAAQTTFQLARSSFAPHLAMGKPAAQSSTPSGFDTPGAKAAVDGNTDGNFSAGSVIHTDVETNAWWEVDLGASVPIGSIVIWNRTDCCGTRLSDYWVFVSDTPFLATDTPTTLQNRPGTFASHQTTAPNPSTTILAGARGRYVRVQLSSANYLSLSEVQVY